MPKQLKFDEQARRGLEASHFLVEDLPQEVASELTAFLAPRRNRRSPARTTEQEAEHVS